MFLSGNKFQWAALVPMSMAFILFSCGVAFSAGDTDVIVIKKKTAPAPLATYVPGQAEMEFTKLMKKLSCDVSYTIEETVLDSTEVSGESSTPKSAKVFVKDSESVRLEFNDANGNPAVSVYSGGNLWVYFPKTNMIMDLPKEGSRVTQGPHNFIDKFLARPQDYLVGRTREGGASNFEVLEKSGGDRVADYRFGSGDSLERIAIYDRDSGTREVKVSSFKFGQNDPALFERPQNAVKMNLGNTTETEK